MRYDIGLRISYAYAHPADTGRQVLHLMPADLPGQQRLIAGSLDIKPNPDEWIGRKDFFGNSLVEVAYRSSHEMIEFRVQARVERVAPATRFDVSPGLSLLARELDECVRLDSASPLHFIDYSALVPPEPAIAAYARNLAKPAMSAFELVRTIGVSLNRDMQFDSTATTVNTPIGEAFARRRGVCQDFSHVMIASLRSLGVPAGYVSGYLHTIPPEGHPRLQGADAMHAWIRAWCGIEMGWIEFDPTNALQVENHHITIASGRDYSDVAPIKGVLRTAGTQSSTQAVDVVLLDGVDGTRA
jgi:transglutaminase-like putative cysteine protease